MCVCVCVCAREREREEEEEEEHDSHQEIISLPEVSLVAVLVLPGEKWEEREEGGDFANLSQ